MKTLKHYVDQKNGWGAIFGEKELEFPLSPDGVKKIAYGLDGEFSPENLHCDGEISVAEARRKFAYFETVFLELKTYATNKGYSMPEMMEYAS